MCTHTLQKSGGGGRPGCVFLARVLSLRNKQKTFAYFFNIFLMLSNFIYISQTTKLSEKNQTFKHAEPRGTVCGSNFSIRCS